MKILYKSRWILLLPCRIDENLKFLDSTIEVIATLSNSPIVVLTENTFLFEGSIEEAFYLSWEKINLFTISCSYIGYGKSMLLSHVATMPGNFDDLEEFDVLIQKVINKETKSYSITQKDLSPIEDTLNSKFSDALICVASALRANSIEEKSVLMHSGCQVMATSVGVDTIKQKCTNCEHEIDSGRPATNNYIKKIFKSTKENSNALYDKFTTLRNKIGHGKPLSTLAQHNSAKFDIALAQGNVTRHLDGLINFHRTAGSQSIVGQPFSVYAFKGKSGNYQVTPKYFSGEAAISTVYDGHPELKEGYQFDYGIYTDCNFVFDAKMRQHMFSLKNA